MKAPCRGMHAKLQNALLFLHEQQTTITKPVEGALPSQLISPGVKSTSVYMYCCRSSMAFKQVMDNFPDKSVFVVSTRAMKLLDSHLKVHLPLKMSWSEEPHNVFVYESRMAIIS